MKTQSAYEVVSVLVTKATTLQTYLGGTAGHQSLVDEHSDQTWYGVPEAVIDDLKQAIDLVVLCQNKVNTIVDPQTII